MHRLTREQFILMLDMFWIKQDVENRRFYFPDFVRGEFALDSEDFPKTSFSEGSKILAARVADMLIAIANEDVCPEVDGDVAYIRVGDHRVMEAACVSPLDVMKRYQLVESALRLTPLWDDVLDQAKGE